MGQLNGRFRDMVLHIIAYYVLLHITYQNPDYEAINPRCERDTNL